MARPKTKFTIFADGCERLLLSVIELPDKSLTIIPKFAKYVRTTPQNRPVVTETHFSVHNSPSWFGNELKFTRNISDGTKEEIHYRTVSIAAGQFFNIFSMAYARMANDHFAYKHKNRDTHVKLGSYDASRTVLVLTVVISMTGFPLDIYDKRLFSVFRDFDQYRVTVIYNQISIPSGEDGSTVFTGASKVGRETEFDKYFPNLVRDLVFIIDEHWGAFEALRKDQIKALNHQSKTVIDPEYLIKPAD